MTVIVVVVVIIAVFVALVIVAAVGLAERATVLELAFLTLRAVEIRLAVHRAVSSAISISSGTISAVRLAERLAVLELAFLTLRAVEVRLACTGGAVPTGCQAGRQLRRARVRVAATVSQQTSGGQ